MLRRARSNPSKKKGNAEKKLPFVQAIAVFNEYQTGLDLSKGYRLGSHIAAGADGDVFRGLAKESGNEVAIKRIRMSSATIQRHVQQEVIAAFHSRKMYAEELGDPNALGHPCIVHYFDWFAGPAGLDREVCIVMELCNFGIGELVHTGKVMRSEYEKIFKAQQPLQMQAAAAPGAKARPVPTMNQTFYRFPEREILKVMFQMLSALSFLNRHGIVHRDIKTENILWNSGVPEGCYKLADFGVAFCEVDDGSQRYDDCGTLWTMAPELLGRRSTPGPSCDVWSLGVVLFEMAFFEKPFTSLELLGFRNGDNSAMNGFWQTITGSLQRSSGPPTSPMGRSINGGGGSTTSSPRQPGGGRAARGLLKQQSSASVPSLPAVGGQTSPKSATSGSSPKANGTDLASPKLGTSKSVSKLLRSRTVGCMDMSKVAGDDEPVSPMSPLNTMNARKRTFLRKRGGLRWIYSEDLRIAIFDEMFEEEASARSTPEETLSSVRLQNMLAMHDRRGWLPLDDRPTSSGTSRPPSTPGAGSHAPAGTPRSARQLPMVAKATAVGVSEAISWADAPLAEPVASSTASPAAGRAAAASVSAAGVEVVGVDSIKKSPRTSKSLSSPRSVRSTSRPASAKSITSRPASATSVSKSPPVTPSGTRDRQESVSSAPVRVSSASLAVQRAEQVLGAEAAAETQPTPASDIAASQRPSSGRSRPEAGQQSTPQAEPACTPTFAGMSLKQLTPEAFLQVLAAERNVDAAVGHCAAQLAL